MSDAVDQMRPTAHEETSERETGTEKEGRKEENTAEERWKLSLKLL